MISESFVGLTMDRYLKKVYHVDVTEIFRDLNSERKLRLIKLAFYLVLFFLIIYRYVLIFPILLPVVVLPVSCLKCMHSESSG